MDETNVSEDLVAREQQLMNAIAAGDTAVWLRYLHEDCLIAVEDGSTTTRQKLVSDIKPLPKGYVGKINVIEPKVQRYGDTAVISYIADEYLELYGQKIHTQYRQTNTWKQENGDWRMIGMQLFEIPKNPPAIEIEEAILKRYEGNYALAADRKCVVTVRGGVLYAQKTDRDPQALLAETENVFFRKNDGRVRVMFFRDRKSGYRMVERRAGEDVVWTRQN